MERVYFDKCSRYPSDLEKLHSDLDVHGLVEQVARCGIKVGIFFAGVGILKKQMHSVGVLETVIGALKSVCARFNTELSYGCYGVTDSQCIDWIGCIETNADSYRNACNHVLMPEKSRGIDIPNISGLRRLPFVFMVRALNLDTRTSGSLCLVDLGTPFDADHVYRSSEVWSPVDSKLDIGVFRASFALHKLVDMLGPHGADGEADVEKHALTGLVRDILIRPSRLTLCLLIDSDADPNRVARALRFSRSWKKLRTMEIETPASPGRLSLETELSALREKLRNAPPPIQIAPPQSTPPDSSLVLKYRHICELSDYRNQVRKLSSLLEVSRLRSKKLITTLMVRYIELEESQRLASVARMQREYYFTKLKWKISVSNIRIIILRRSLIARTRALLLKISALESKKHSIDKKLVKSILADRSLYIQREKNLLEKLEKYKQKILILSGQKNVHKRIDPTSYKRLKDRSKILASQLLAAKLKINSKRKEIALLEKTLSSSAMSPALVQCRNSIAVEAGPNMP